MSKPTWSKIFRRLLVTILGLGVVWVLLTLWVEKKGARKNWQSGGTPSSVSALIVFDPDPFYNLDEQVCLSLAQGFADHGFKVNVSSVAAAKEFNVNNFDLYVICANTYNWRPDWAVSNFIRGHSFKNKPVLAITLGAGSTSSSQKALEKMIADSNGILMDSRTFWLIRPNDESRTEEHNVSIAKSMSYSWASEIATEFQPLP